jgi:hypothetical protein
MKLSLNLRGDLAKLTDQELAERLDQSSQAYDAASQSRWSGWVGKPSPIRGPIRHPRAYRVLATLPGMSGSIWIDLLVAGIASSKSGEKALRWLGWPQVDMYLHGCEIRDIVDEAKRRMEQREGQNS